MQSSSEPPISNKADTRENLSAPGRTDGAEPRQDDDRVEEPEVSGDVAPAAAPQNSPVPAPDRGTKKKKEKSPTDRLLELATKFAELFHTREGEAWATVKVAGKPTYHQENWPLRSRRFRAWITEKYYATWGRTFDEASYQQAVKALEAMAVFDGKEREVFTRVGEHAGKLYLDLANDAWQAVEISPDQWRVVDQPPIVFRRTKGMEALPTPSSGGQITELGRFVNVTGDDFVLLVAFILSAMRPTGPFPIANIVG